MISPIFPCLVVRPSVHMVTSLLLQFHIVLPSPQTTQPHPLIEMVDSGHLVMNMVTEFKRVDIVEHLVSLADCEGGVEELHPLLFLTIKL